MVQMRVNLNCIVWYILMELDWFLKLHKDGENCFTAVLQTKRCIISLRGITVISYPEQIIYQQ